MNKENNNGVILIPDFSGFTNFVLTNNLYTGSYITQNLLNTILDNNILKYTVSEIEGDAILFYKFGQPETKETITYQAKKMEQAFTKSLEKLGKQLKTKIQLSLKFIVHYGEFSEYLIGSFKKLYGSTVVEAHKLLKYHYVEHQPYILFSQQYLESVSENTNVIQFSESNLPDVPKASIYSPSVGLIEYI